VIFHSQALSLPAKPRRSLLVGLVFVSAVSLAAGWTAGAVVASSGSQASPAATATAGNDIVNGPALGVPAAGQGSTEPGVAQGSSASGVVYPYQVDPSLGVAPEGTILAAGTGTADMNADGSDRATALPKATGAALVDARAGAQAAATAMGVSITGIYSVSVSFSDSYVYPTSGCAVPMPLLPDTAASGPGDGGQATVTSPPAPASVPATAGSPAVCLPGSVSSATSMQLVVTVIVAYRFS
jgi:hypothetical protein